MWYTGELGVRVLQGAERRFYAQLLQIALEYIENDLPWYGVNHFDELTNSERISAWAEIFTALTSESVEQPNQTALLESCAYAPYEIVRTLISMEIEASEFEDEPNNYYRKLIWSAYASFVLAENEKYYDNVCKPENDENSNQYSFPQEWDLDDWDEAIEDLADRILPDRDWELRDSDPPTLNQTLAQNYLAIAHDYFATDTHRRFLEPRETAEPKLREMLRFCLAFSSQSINHE